jgi:transposase
VCWAHLKRDFQGWVDAGGVGALWGQALLEQARQLFHLYHRMKDGALQRTTFEQRVPAIRAEVGHLLRRAEACADPRVAGQAHSILKLEPALWTFASIEGVEPTNNHAERALRHAVLWRKTSGGTQSARGSRFVERILTVFSTLRQQGRDVLEYLTYAMHAHLLGQPPPSLLPGPG